MALWQFDFYIVPRERCVIAEDLEIDFLEKETAWTKDIVQYGKADETCIQFLYEDGSLEEISCRFDLRSLSRKMLKEILDYVVKIEGMIFMRE